MSSNTIREQSQENTLVEFSGRAGVCDPLTDLPRKGAHQLPQAAVASGLETFLAEFSIRRLPGGRAAVVRNGHHPERAVRTGIGPVMVQNPKGAQRRAHRSRSTQRLCRPVCARRKPLMLPSPGSISRAFPPAEMGAALKALPGADAKGFPVATVARLKTQWAAEYDIWRKSDPGRDEWACIRADGIRSGLRGGDDLVVRIGCDRRKRPWRKAFSHHGRWCAGKHPELA